MECYLTQRCIDSQAKERHKRTLKQHWTSKKTICATSHQEQWIKSDFTVFPNNHIVMTSKTIAFRHWTLWIKGSDLISEKCQAHVVKPALLSHIPCGLEVGRDTISPELKTLRSCGEIYRERVIENLLISSWVQTSYVLTFCGFNKILGIKGWNTVSVVSLHNIRVCYIGS